MNKALKILVDQDYISSRYEKAFKLQGKGPRYYIRPKGVRRLSEQYGFDERVVRNQYKNKTVSNDFVEHNVDVLAVHTTLRAIYPDVFVTRTRTSLAATNHFLQQRPDLYLHRRVLSTQKPNDYLIEVFDNVPNFVMKKRFDDYIEHYYDDDMPPEMENAYPAILFVCPSRSAEKTLRTHIRRSLDNDYNLEEDTLLIYTTTLALRGLQTATPTDNAAIWRRLYYYSDAEDVIAKAERPVGL